MKLCSVCLTNNFLCSGCARKLERNEITQAEVDVSRTIFRLGLMADFTRAVESSGVLAIFASKAHSGVLIGRAGRNVKRISSALDKDVRIVEETNDEKKLIERVLNAPVLGINKVYGKNESYKIKLENRSKKRVSTALLEKVIGKKVSFVFN